MNKSRKFAALLIITIILIAFGTVAHAQDDEEDGEEHGLYLAQRRLFWAGFVGGVNFAQVDGDNFAGYHKVGANVGGIGYWNFHKHVSLSWEMLYSQKGSKSDVYRVSGLDSILIVKYGINANYAEIPVMINYFDQHKSHIGIGVSYSRLVAATETLTTAPAYPIDLNKYPFAKNNVDFLAGAQLHLVKGLFLNIRFQYSITPIRTDSPPYFSRASNEYNNIWVVRLMYLFM
jgi:outer membrane protein with beta-barrel domain